MAIQTTTFLNTFTTQNPNTQETIVMELRQDNNTGHYIALSTNFLEGATTVHSPFTDGDTLMFDTGEPRKPTIGNLGYADFIEFVFAEGNTGRYKYLTTDGEYLWYKEQIISRNTLSNTTFYLIDNEDSEYTELPNILDTLQSILITLGKTGSRLGSTAYVNLWDPTIPV